MCSSSRGVAGSKTRAPSSEAWARESPEVWGRIKVILNRARLENGVHPLQLAFAPGGSCTGSTSSTSRPDFLKALLLLPAMHRSCMHQLPPDPDLQPLQSLSQPCRDGWLLAAVNANCQAVQYHSSNPTANPTHWDSHAGLKGCSSGGGCPKLCHRPPAAAELMRVR